MPPTIVPAILHDSLEGINFEHGRLGSSGVPCPFPVDTIFIHVTEGDAASVRSWFNNPAAQASAHYMVTKAGTIVQFVDEDDKAYGVGKPVAPTARLVRERFAQGGWGANSYSISIEHEGSGKEELTDRQRAASYELQLDIIARRAIPVDRDHILGHHESKATKLCPGRISVDRIVSDLQSMLSTAPQDNQPLINDDYPRAVWSNVLKDYVAVADYQSDSAWTYVPFRELAGKGKKAGAPLSAFPLRRPEP